MPISVKKPPDFPAVASPLRTLIVSALALEECRPGEIGIVLAGDAFLRELNRDYRGIDRATDVLSFAYDESGEVLNPGTKPAKTRPVDGDLVISLDRMQEQAQRYGVAPGRELARLVVHGALHLAGLDHAQEAERTRMRARENAALKSAAGAIKLLEARLPSSR